MHHNPSKDYFIKTGYSGNTLLGKNENLNIAEYLKLALSREENVVELIHLLIQIILCSNPGTRHSAFTPIASIHPQ